MENAYEQMASNSQSEHQVKQFKSKQQLKKEVNKKKTEYRDWERSSKQIRRKIS